MRVGTSPSPFQSSLGPKPECNPLTIPSPTPKPGSFNPHSGRSPSATLPSAPRVASIKFQSSLGPKPECNLSSKTRYGSLSNSFNPHSGRSPSATLSALTSREEPNKFQSSLGPKPECNTARFERLQALISVSILTRAEARVQLSGCRYYSHCSSVSILTRAEARVQPACAAVCVCGVSWSFNPHSGRSPSATPSRTQFAATSPLFQSSLGPKPECNAPSLAHVLDRAQGAVCANPPKGARGR